MKAAARKVSAPATEAEAMLRKENQFLIADNNQLRSDNEKLSALVGGKTETATLIDKLILRAERAEKLLHNAVGKRGGGMRKAAGRRKRIDEGQLDLHLPACELCDGIGQTTL